MPSTFLSLLLIALTLERATAAPARSTLSTHFDARDGSLPQWAIDACNNSPGCKIQNNFPTYQTPARIKPVNYAANPAVPSNGVQQAAVDDSNRDYFNVEFDNQYVGTGMCAPDEFLRILFERSECPIGSDSIECGATAEYLCGYTDAEVGYFPPFSDSNNLESPRVDKCTMTFYGQWITNGPIVRGGPGNSKYSDTMKQYAIDSFSAAMRSPQGNGTQTPYGLPAVTTYMVPQKLSLLGMRGAGAGNEAVDNKKTGTLTINIKCAVPQQKMDCGIWPTLVNNMVGLIPEVGNIFSAGFNTLSGTTCR